MPNLSVNNRRYYNSIFLSTLNKTVGEDFYTRLFEIYNDAKEFMMLRSNSVASESNLDFTKLNNAMEDYTTQLTEIVNNLAQGKYEENFKQKLDNVYTKFDFVLTQLQSLNNLLNPYNKSANRLQEIVKNISENYSELHKLGKLKIFTKECKDNCRISFLSLTGLYMQNVFEQNWETAQKESKILINLANATMRVISSCPTGTEEVNKTDLVKINLAVKDLESLK